MNKELLKHDRAYWGWTGGTILLVLAFVFGVGLSGCTTAKKVTSTTSTQKDSTGSKVAIVETSNSTDSEYSKENTTTINWTDAFMTDADSGYTYMDLDTGETEVFETGGIKIQATKDGKGGISISYTDKPKKAYGKASETSVTKEQGKASTETKTKTAESSHAVVSATVKTRDKDKTTTGIPWWVWAVGIGALLLVMWLVYRKVKAGMVKKAGETFIGL